MDLDLRGIGPEPMTLAWIRDRMEDRYMQARDVSRILLDDSQMSDIVIEARLRLRPTEFEGVKVVVGD